MCTLSIARSRQQQKKPYDTGTLLNHFFFKHTDDTPR